MYHKTIQLQGVYTKRLKAAYSRDTHAHYTLLTIAKSLNQAQSPLLDEWMKK